ncbi:MAG: ammonia-forming cytochrome c nitrite reductase subunit c552, partial [Syntrophothermus sp.]
PVPSINEQAKNSPLGSRHWNIFRNVYNNPEDPEQSRCIGCHSAVAIVDDPKAKLTDFLKAGQEYCYEEVENPAPGQPQFLYKKATEDGKYVDNNFEGITCRVCHVMDKNGLTLRRPDKTCTLCHGRVFNWKTGSGHHVEQDFIEGHGETSWDQSVHYTIGMQCQDCHTMNSVKHDYEPAKPEDIVKDALCLNCHKSAGELEKMIETTKSKVSAALKAIDARLKAANDLVAADKVKDADAAKALIAKAKARNTFVASDYSNGVHNPQFAAKLINEANAALDEFDKMTGKATKTPALDLSKLSVFLQAQTSKLGAAHWDMLENTVFNPEDPDQDRCIGCHSAVAIVDDPKAKVADFLAKGQKYCTQELENAPAGQSPFVYTEVTQDGKYVKNHLEGITCRVCHTFNKDGNIGLLRDKEKTCGLCHGRSFNWNTGSGHHIELAFFKGQGSKEKGVADMPSLKANMGYACQDCHFMDSTKHDFEAATPAQIGANAKCKSCHNAAKVEGYIKGIQSEVTATIAKLQPRLDAAKAYVDKHPDNAQAKELYTQAKAGVTFVNDDFSKGVHNPQFARTLLARSTKLLNEFEAKFK